MSAFEDPRDERDLTSVLSRRVARSPDKPWLVTDDGSYSYRDIDSRSGRLARGFAEAGVAAGDTVALMLPDTVEYICLWCALSKIGAIEVPVNVHHRGSILSYLINDSQAEVPWWSTRSTWNGSKPLQAISTTLEADLSSSEWRTMRSTPAPS